MASSAEEKSSSSKLVQKRKQLTSKVTFDLNDFQPIDDANEESLEEVDEFLEFSTLSNNPSTSSMDLTTNSPKILSNSENKKQYFRYLYSLEKRKSL